MPGRKPLPPTPLGGERRRGQNPARYQGAERAHSDRSRWSSRRWGGRRDVALPQFKPKMDVGGPGAGAEPSILAAKCIRKTQQNKGRGDVSSCVISMYPQRSGRLQGVRLTPLPQDDPRHRCLNSVARSPARTVRKYGNSGPDAGRRFKIASTSRPIRISAGLMPIPVRDFNFARV